MLKPNKAIHLLIIIIIKISLKYPLFNIKGDMNFVGGFMIKD